MSTQKCGELRTLKEGETCELVDCIYNLDVDFLPTGKHKLCRWIVCQDNADFLHGLCKMGGPNPTLHSAANLANQPALEGNLSTLGSFLLLKLKSTSELHVQARAFVLSIDSMIVICSNTQ